MAAESFSFLGDRMRKAARLPWFIVLALLARCVPRDRRRWVIGRRSGVGDGPLALVQAARARDASLQVVWLTRNADDDRVAAVHGIAYVRRDSMWAVWLSLRAGVGVMTHGFSDLCGPAIWGAQTVQLWHGAPLKRIGLDRRDAAAGTLLGRLAAGFERYWNRHYTHVIAGSWAVAGRLRSAMGLGEGTVKVTGDPRMDLVPGHQAKARTMLVELARRHGCDGNCLVLVAPTWRDGGDVSVDPDDAARARLAAHPEAVLFVRAHPHSAEIEALADMANVVALPPAEFPDITPLLGGFDVLVTDYSSIAMDFAPLGRPIMLVAPDLHAYEQRPGLYESYAVFSYGTAAPDWNSVFAALGRVCSGDPDVYEPHAALARILARRFHPLGMQGNAERVLDLLLWPMDRTA